MINGVRLYRLNRSVPYVGRRETKPKWTGIIRQEEEKKPSSSPSCSTLTVTEECMTTQQKAKGCSGRVEIVDPSPIQMQLL